ncbi:hypothetical protein [Rhodococcus wratislaviensis]|uniref:Uncharacterized protein n=1 Tax=Rhodococcus wratislaviensis NBRC 100605 TaxID=1219028 RepID=X0PVQ3_RHOWR|nr:hypothetical protein [Rhodococcus wratislaviensis]GAF47374.1 hypothetical protein RW1_040_00360 [Rhodococcus wratislaviensis NBRC 100605]
MSYSKLQWSDGPAGGTAISAERLNHMEAGIESAHLTLTEDPPGSGLYVIGGQDQ